MSTIPTPSASRWRAGVERFWSQAPGARRWQTIAATGALLAIALGVALWLGWRRDNPLLSTPRLALESLQAKSLYYNGLSWRWLHEQRRDLLRSEDQAPDSPRVRSFTQAVQNPKLFRQLDRQERFDALLLIGSPSQYRPLLDHLLEARDWSLAYVDHTSVVFRRDQPAPWQPSQLASLRARFAQASRREQATFLAQTASKLIALRQAAPARELLESAEALGGKVAEVASVRAEYHLSRGEWGEAVAAADRALAADAGNPSALGSKAQALYATKHFNEAYTLSKRLIERLPEDPAILFYHAKIAHDARAFGEETKALRHLIALAQASERPVSTYRVYLGQSLASAGEAEPALEQLRLALADPDLPAAQRDFARDCMALIQSQQKK